MAIKISGGHVFLSVDTDLEDSLQIWRYLNFRIIKRNIKINQLPYALQEIILDGFPICLKSVWLFLTQLHNHPLTCTE